MEHAPYFRDGTEQTAVLLIHGIVGSPAHFRDLVPVIPQSFPVYNMALDGHLGTVPEFGRSSMAKWKRQVEEALESLFSRYSRVLIVAHSMGTLFAIQAAIRHRDRISGLFLLSVPTRPWVRPSTLCTAIRVLWGAEDPAAAAMRGDTGMALTRRLWEYIPWIPRFLELLAECRRVRKILPRLSVPTQVFQSRVDELVSFRSCKDWADNPAVTTTVLPDSGHFVYSRRDACLMQSRLSRMLDSLKNPSII